MKFDLVWTDIARAQYDSLREKAEKSSKRKKQKGKRKSSKAEGIFKQVHKTIMLLRENLKHPGLNTHEYSSLTNPYDPKEKVWEAYAQHRTPGAYRVFWCYGPATRQLTLIAITPHP